MVVRPSEVQQLAAQIREAIKEELNVSSRGLPFKAITVDVKGGLLTTTLAPQGRKSVLDESLDEGTLTWKNGSAEIISLEPAFSVVHARLKNGSPFRNGMAVYVKPPRYLNALGLRPPEDSCNKQFQ